MLIFALLSAQAADSPTLVAIRARWKAVTAGQLEGCRNGETGEVRFDQRIDWNPKKEQRPAIGTYVEQVDLYRLWCHPGFEGSVLKAVSRTRVAASLAMDLTVLYDDQARPMFVLDTGDTRIETRIYWDEGQVFRVASKEGERSEIVKPTGALLAYAEGIKRRVEAYPKLQRELSESPVHPWSPLVR